MAKLHPIQAFRERQNPPLSRNDLALILGVDRLTVHRWETGTRLPDLGLLPTITKKTGIPGYELRPDLAKLIGACPRASADQ